MVEVFDTKQAVDVGTAGCAAQIDGHMGRYELFEVDYSIREVGIGRDCWDLLVECDP